MSDKRKKITKKVLKFLAFFIGFLFLAILIIPIIFEDTVSEKIKNEVNNNINANFGFDDSNISFFTHFPNLSFSFQNVNLRGKDSFSDTSLLKAKELSFGINVYKLIFGNKIEVNKTYIIDSDVLLIKDKYDRVNYDLVKTTDSIEDAETEIKSESSIDLNFEGLELQNTNVIYKDEANNITLYTKNINYSGNLKFLEEKLELGSELNIENIDLVFNGIDYLKGKKLKAKSFTIYDTKNLSVELDENSIWLNGLNVDFEGILNIFEEGVAYDLHFKTKNGDFKKLASILPPEYMDWSNNLRILKGKLNADLHLRNHSGNVPNDYKTDQSTLNLVVSDGIIAHKDSKYNLEDLLLKMNGTFKGNYFDVKIDSLSFSMDNEKTFGNLELEGQSDSLLIKSYLRSKINLDKLNKALLLPDLQFTGLLETDWISEGIYQPKAKKFPKSRGYFKLNDGEILTSHHPEPIKNINLIANINNEGYDYDSSILEIDTLSFSFMDNPFTTKGKFENFENLKYDIQGKGKIDFTSLHEVVDLPFLFSQGNLDADFSLDGQIGDQSNNKHSGRISLQNIDLESDVLQNPIYIDEGDFIFLNDRVGFSDLKVHYNNSNVILNGYFKDYLKYFIYNKEVLHGDVEINSKKIDITSFFPKKEVLEKTTDSLSSTSTITEITSGVLQIPKNLDISLRLKIDSLQYNALDITNLKGDLAIKEEVLILKNGKLDMADGSAKLEGVYNALSTEKALFSMELDAQKLNIKKAYNSMVLFKELLPVADKASGFLSTKYSLSGILNQEMSPDLESLKGGGETTGYDIQFEDYKLMGKLSKQSGFDALDNPKVSEIKINSTIENNVLNLEEFKFKVKPFRLRTEGQISLDGDLNLRMRIGLPPIGIIGIPVTIKGPSDTFEIKLGKKSKDLNTQEFQDSDFSDDDIDRLNTLKDSIREGNTLKEINIMKNEIIEDQTGPSQLLNDIWLLETVWIDDEMINIELNTFQKGSPILEINTRNMTFIGHEGCNEIKGKLLEIDKENISFGPITSTEIMCPNIDLSQSYVSNLGQVNGYQYKELKLTFYKDGKPLQKYKKID